MNSALVTVVIGDHWKNLFDVMFREPMQNFADKQGLPLIVIDELIDGTFSGRRNPAWQKCLLWKDARLKGIDRVLYLDADVLCAPDAENPLLYLAGEWAGVLENTVMTVDNVSRVYQSRKISTAHTTMINTGVLCLSRSTERTMEDVYWAHPELTIQVEAENEGWYEEPYLSNAFLGLSGTVLTKAFNYLVYKDISLHGGDAEWYKTLVAEQHFIHCAGDGKNWTNLEMLRQAYCRIRRSYGS
jgi:hypothetical protein